MDDYPVSGDSATSQPAGVMPRPPGGLGDPALSVGIGRLPGQLSQRMLIRVTLTVIGLGLATLVAVDLVLAVRRTLTWMLVAAFFAVALYPVVNWVERRVPRCRRSLATLLVFLIVLVVLGALAAAFIVPLAQEGTNFAGQLPGFIADARSGRGAVGDILTRTHALRWVQENQSKIQSFATGLTSPAAGVVRGVATGVAGTVTVFVLSYLMVLEGPKIVDGSLGLLEEGRRERVRRVGIDCARSITGYISGNLLISVICGGLTYAALRLLNVPFAGLISLFVAIADLIPLIGATLGAVVAGVAGFIHSVPAGIAVVVFFVVYQQVENHLLQPLIFARTVKLNPLMVLVAILLAAELAGILGALLAIPLAGILQVIARDIWDQNRGRLKPTPAVGEEHAPLDPA